MTDFFQISAEAIPAATQEVVSAKLVRVNPGHIPRSRACSAGEIEHWVQAEAAAALGRGSSAGIKGPFSR